MKDLPAISRYMHLPEELLRFPVELLIQGYEPNYLATYRPDELGGLDSKTLTRLKRSVLYEASLSDHKEQIAQTLQKDGLWTDVISQVVRQCTSISQVDAIVKNLRGRKTAKAFADSDPNIEKIGQAILLHRGENVQDCQAWVQNQAGISAEDAQVLMPKVKRWLQLLLGEDAQLMLTLQRALIKNAVASVKILPEPSKESESAQVSASESIVDSAEIGQSVEQTSQDSSQQSSTVALSSEVQSDATPLVLEQTQEPATTADAESVLDGNAQPQPSKSEPSIASFQSERKKTREIKTKSLSDKQLSPRQRRRRWLRGILESYAKLRKPLRELTPFQILMLSRGLRSQIIQLQFQIDTKPLVQLCRDSLCPGRHPMHPLLMEVADSGLKEFLLPKLQQDVLGILEEDANQALIESAVDHLETVMLQRPVHGHRILLIDAVGQKTAAVAIVDAQGSLIMTGDIVCNSSKPDVVAQNVTQLGQWVHEHQVTLVAISNGHARRYLIHSVAELMKQSAEGTLYWTFADRQGADAFCTSRNSLVELPKISRRHRAAVWLAWKLQDPLRQILKIEPARLRLGSYQRELPQAELESALQEAISSAITKAGVDMYQADIEVLKRIPGMDDATAKRLVEERPKGTISNRESLAKFLKESLAENKARQAIGFLRVYQSENSLDGTIIHPEDYRLAERLVAHAQLPALAACPEGWQKPDYEKIAEAVAAAQSMTLDGTTNENSDSVEAYGFDSHDQEINPNFGVMESDQSDQSDQSDHRSDRSDRSVRSSTIDQSDQSDQSDHRSDGSDRSVRSSTIDQSDQSDQTDHRSDGSDRSVRSSTIDQTDQSDQSDQSDQTDHRSDGSDRSDRSSTIDQSDQTDQTDHRSDGSDRSDRSSTGPTRVVVAMPPIYDKPLERPTLAIDADKLARSWQVGRHKLLSVSRSLQFPFADGREFQYPIPLRSNVPSMDKLETGTMLSALVIGIANFGVFVELGPDCTGLVHVSQLGQSFVEDAHQFVQVGDVIPVWVLHTDSNKKRVALTMRPPGSKTESSERRPSTSGPGEDRSNRQDRAQRQDRRGQNRPASNPGGAEVRSDKPNNRPGSRPDDRRSRGPGNSRGFGRKQDVGKTNEAAESRPHRQVKISRPIPEKPISEAMQQGKEPLRSFGDLMQFFKKGPSTGETSESQTPIPPPPAASDTASEPPADSAPKGVDPQATGDDDVGV